MFKLIRRLVGLVFILVVLAVVLFFSADTLAEGAVEKGGTWALGVETTLDDADVGLLTGSFALEGLRVANPPGFRSEPMLEMRWGGTELDVGSVFKDTIRVDNLTLEGIKLRLEQSAGKTNYGVIVDSLKRFESKDGKPSEGKKYIIKEIVIHGVECVVDLLPIGGALTSTPVKIPELRLADVGTESNQGVILAEVMSVVVKALFQAVAERGAGIPGLGDFTKDLGGQLGGLISLGGQGMGVLDKLGGAGNDIRKIGEGLGNLLGGKK